MDITEFEARSHHNAIRRDVDRYGVADHALDLATHGFTVVPPSRLGVTDEWIERLRDGVIRSCGQPSGTGHCDAASTGAWGQAMGHDLVEEDDVFEQAARNPVGLALIQLFLGENAFRVNDRPIAKNRRDSDLLTPEGYVPLHNDVYDVALGSGSECLMLKAAWLCTDHTGKGDGSIIVVPGSFRFGRVTLPHEWDPVRSPHPIVHLTGKAGSLAIWRGGTFHGTAPRTKAGLHVMLLQDWFRSHTAKTTAQETHPTTGSIRLPVLS